MEIMINAEEVLGVNVNTDAEFLEKIVEYIDVHGHTTGALARGEKRCLVGAGMYISGCSTTASMVKCYSTPASHGFVFTRPFAATRDRLINLLGQSPTELNDQLDLEWPDIRDIVLNKAKDLRNNERTI